MDDWKKHYPDSTIIISSKLFHKEIYDQLITQGVSYENIINAGELIDLDNRAQYFDLFELKPMAEEIFVDCGAFDGLTSEMFLSWASGADSQVIAFEPDPENRKKYAERLNHLGSSYQIYPVCVWDKTTRLKFNNNLKGASHISFSNDSQEMSIEIDAEKIDNLLDKKITFLKMDIEGAEYEAIRGAEKLIKKFKPKLAICVYHKPEDLYIIPDLLLNFVPEYKFWLRHYSVGEGETVLYAI